MPDSNKQANSQSILHRLGISWIAMGLTLSIHVLDEALNDFLSVYNPNVEAIRRKLPFLPIPAFTFKTWIAGLSIGVLLILVTSYFAFRGSKIVIMLSFPLGILMFLNGLGHIGSSLFYFKLMPGVYSSPLLLVASSFMLISARRARKTHHGT